MSFSKLSPGRSKTILTIGDSVLSVLKFTSEFLQRAMIDRKACTMVSILHGAEAWLVLTQEKLARSKIRQGGVVFRQQAFNKFECHFKWSSIKLAMK